VSAVPGRGQGIYATSKFAVLGLSEALRSDLEPKGIGVSVLCPGFVKSGIFESGRNRPDRFGGRFMRSPDHPLKQGLDESGLDARAVGRRVRKAVEDDELYIITHPEFRALVEERHKSILEAFDHAEGLAFFEQPEA